MKRRIVVPAGSLSAGRLTLEEDLGHYLRDVLRLPAGEALDLRDGAGLRADAVLVASSRREVIVEVASVEAAPPPAGLQLTLHQAIAKGEKVDQVVRQATELGVARIVPVLTARSVPRQEKRVPRWRAIADDAVRVSGRAFRPVVEEVQSFEAVLGRERAQVALVPAVGAALGLHGALASAGGAATAEVLIGPEGGLTAEEVEAAEAAGFRAVSLGPNVLRTETAGPALAAVLSFWGGELGR